MVSFLKLMSLIAALGLAACATPPQTQPAVSISASITPVQLVAHAAELEGQRISVHGYFTYVTDTRALWESEAAAADAMEQRLGVGVDYWAKCVTIYPDGIGARRFDRRSVVVTGSVSIIGEDDIRSLWTCNAVALENAVITPE